MQALERGIIGEKTTRRERAAETELHRETGRKRREETREIEILLAPEKRENFLCSPNAGQRISEKPIRVRPRDGDRLPGRSRRLGPPPFASVGRLGVPHGPAEEGTV